MDVMALYQETLATILDTVGAVQSPESALVTRANCKNVLVRIFQQTLLLRRRVLADTLYRQSRGVIQKGAFAGLTLPESFLHQEGPLVPSLLGTYEEELQPYWNQLIPQYVPLIIQVGAAEGYYAAGLARSMPNSYIVVYDSSPHVREKLAKSAALNGVAGRVEVRAACGRDELEAILMRYPGTFLLMDCAGAERELLDPEQAPALRHTPFIVECHDQEGHLLSTTVLKRFQESHRLSLVQQSARDPHAFPLLHSMDEFSRWLCVDENRSSLKQWLIAEPKKPQRGVIQTKLFSHASHAVPSAVEESAEGMVSLWRQTALAEILALVGADPSPEAVPRSPADCMEILEQIFSRALHARWAGFTGLVIHFAQGRVQSGPFAGLRLVQRMDSQVKECIIPKLLGTYQEELHPHLTRILNHRYPQIVVTGAAEGYYAVGLARNLPTSRLLAFDRSPHFRELLEQTAQAHGVGDRVAFHGPCTPEKMESILSPQPGSFLLLDDDDGGELLDPERLPGLLQTDFIVTCRHDADHSLLPSLMIRFQKSHHLRHVGQGGRNPHRFPLLKNLAESDRWLCVNENRPEGLYWLVAEVKQSPAGAQKGRLIPPDVVFPPLLGEKPEAHSVQPMMTICYAINGAFVRQMTVSLVSLLWHNHPDRCELFILCDDEAYQQRGVVQKVLERFRHRVEFIRIDDLYRHLPAGFTSAAYYRLALPYVVKRDRLIYLDADTIVEADLTDLWQTDLAGALCAGVQDFSPIPGIGEQIRALGLTSPYINSGILLLDLEGWRREKISEQILEFIAKNPSLICFSDQDGINRILDGRKKLVDRRWNISCFSHDWEEQLACAPHQHILHFVTPCRAWAITGHPPLRKIWERYEFFTPWRGTPLETPIEADKQLQAARTAAEYDEPGLAYTITKVLAEKLLGMLREN